MKHQALGKVGASPPLTKQSKSDYSPIHHDITLPSRNCPAQIVQLSIEKNAKVKKTDVCLRYTYDAIVEYIARDKNNKKIVTNERKKTTAELKAPFDGVIDEIKAKVGDCIVDNK